MKKPTDPAEATQVDDQPAVVKTYVDHPEVDVSVYPSEIDGFGYPTFYTASFDYFATGEGMTIGIVMGYAQSADQIRAMVNEHFGAYYGAGAEVWPKLQIPPGRSALVPEAVLRVVSDPEMVIGNFFYTSKYHLNQS